MKIDPAQYVRVGTAAKLMNVTRAYVNRLIADNRLPAIEIDGQNFVREKDALAFERQPGMGRPKKDA